jgi:glycosyltransferase involved in cell wall biosynthesis
VKVLLAPFETAGVADALRHGLRERGHHADLWTIAEHPFLATQDRLLAGYRLRAAAALVAPLRYDVLHFQFGTTLAEFLDVAWSRVAGRPLALMHYWGDDCRIRTGGGIQPIGAPAGWAEEQRIRERLIRRRLRMAGRLCAAALVSDLEMLEHVRPFFSTVYVVPTPVVLPLRPGVPSPEPQGEGPIVFHAPSDQLQKGTATIRAAIDGVAARRPLRPLLVSGVPRDVVHGELARADIVIDQLNSATSGVLALEAMALGKPVLLQYERDLLAPFARDTPLLAVTPDTLEAELDALAGDPERRARLGEAGRAFVERVHDAAAVGAALEAVYEHARGRPSGCFEATAAGIRPLPSPR